MNLLKRNQLISIISKFQLLAQELVFLGHVVSKDGIELEVDKIQVVYKIPPPKT